MSALVKKSIIEKLLHIGASQEASIIKRIARELLGDDLQSVLDKSALINFSHLKDIHIFEGDHEYVADIQRRDGKNMYFSPSDGWVAVSDEDIALYKINFDWFIREIMNALSIAERHTPKIILEDNIWALGQHRIGKQNTHLIIVRNLGKRAVLDSLIQHLNNHHKGRDPALVITLDGQVPAHLQLPGQNVLMRIEEAIVIEKDSFELNERLLSGKMGGSLSQDGFSGGFRNLIVNGTQYKFTKKQAEAMEFMHAAGKPRHQDEILAEINSTQSKLLQVFRSSGKSHSAWGQVIKSDNKGNYWLEL